eukprot:TRINITY_DN14246_c0_g1_i2.p4 TRINITY_DN14246_c0_g1~~TRINITY_DN14246_c0_g1_i2.p4  ORF type:complete len:116 (-),score=1.05 TRINITY_DN14246_c0_g1_i2:190-537(-)
MQYRLLVRNLGYLICGFLFLNERFRDGQSSMDVLHFWGQELCLCTYVQGVAFVRLYCVNIRQWKEYRVILMIGWQQTVLVSQLIGVLQVLRQNIVNSLGECVTLSVLVCGVGRRF